MKRLTIATLLAGLAATPAWAQASINCPDGAVADARPPGLPACVVVAPLSLPKTNLDAARRACRYRTTGDLGAEYNANGSAFTLTYKWNPPFEAPCKRVQAKIADRDKQAVDAAAAKEKARQAAQDEAALPTIERGISDPDGKPK